MPREGKRIDLGGNAAGRTLGEPRGQDRTPTFSPALRGAGEDCSVCKRLPKVLCQSDPPKLQLKARLPRNAACHDASSKSNPYKFFCLYSYLWTKSNQSTLQGAVRGAVAHRPGQVSRFEELQGLCSVPSLQHADLQLQHPHVLSHACDAFAFQPPLMSHFGAFVYTKLSLNFPCTLMQTIFFTNSAKKRPPRSLLNPSQIGGYS